MINETIARQKVGAMYTSMEKAGSRTALSTRFAENQRATLVFLILSLFLSRSPLYVFSNPATLCPPHRAVLSLHKVPQSILTLAVRGRLVRGC